MDLKVLKEDSTDIALYLCNRVKIDAAGPEILALFFRGYSFLSKLDIHYPQFKFTSYRSVLDSCMSFYQWLI